MSKFYLTLVPALLVALLFSSTAATALLATPLYSRIELDGNKCLFAPPNYANGTLLKSVNCASFQPTDPRLRFVFTGRTGVIKISNNQAFCIDVPGGLLNKPLQLWSCQPTNVHQQIYIGLDTPRFAWSGNVFTDAGNTVIVAPPSDETTQNWTKVDPIIHLIEMNSENVCMEAPRNLDGTRRMWGQVFAAQCDVSNVNQHFIYHPNGAIEVADGSLSLHSGVTVPFCFHNPSDHNLLRIFSCVHGLTSQRFNALSTRMQFVGTGEVLGIDDIDSDNPALAIYADVQADFTKTWQLSLGDAQVMVKFAADDTNLCLDTSATDAGIKVSECTVNTANMCRHSAVNPETNKQSFVLRKGDSALASVALGFADGSNKCVDASKTAEGAPMEPYACHFDPQQMFEIDSEKKRIISEFSRKVLTLGGNVQEPDTLIESSSWPSSGPGMVEQMWDVLPIRLTKCNPYCVACPTSSSSSDSACSENVCIQGLCSPIGEAEKSICCGVDGIDINCLNARANRIDGIFKNWCMKCTDNDRRTGLKGCSIPFIPAYITKQLPMDVTHMRCSYDHANVDGFSALDSKPDANPALKYLALTGVEITLKPLDLSDAFTSLTHLDLSGSKANGILFGSDMIDDWKQLEYANVSECVDLCRFTAGRTCFHFQLNAMTALRVLDLSAMDLSALSTLEPLKTLPALEELYLNDNNLESLPASFFESMSQLTKLRIRNNPMDIALPPSIYTDGFDSDVPEGQTPASTITSSPTKLPTSPLPSVAPTKTPTNGPTVLTSTPTSRPTVTTYSPTRATKVESTKGPTKKTGDGATVTLSCLSVFASVLMVVGIMQ